MYSTISADIVNSTSLSQFDTVSVQKRLKEFAGKVPMDMWWLVANLFVAHLFGDFFLQCKGFCEKKRDENCRGWRVYVHSLVIGLLSWAVVWDAEAWWLALLLGCSHLVVDVAKCAVEKKMLAWKAGRFLLISFCVDQLIHLALIVVFASVWLKCNGWSEFAWVTGNAKWLLTAVALLSASKPANILVNLILRLCKVTDSAKDVSDGEHGSFHSGALIGTLERALTIVFVVLGQYEAIGFLLAAKSILRFSETSKGDEKSEYVLTGTFLSLTIAVALGLLVTKVC